MAAVRKRLRLFLLAFVVILCAVAKTLCQNFPDQPVPSDSLDLDLDDIPSDDISLQTDPSADDRSLQLDPSTDDRSRRQVFGDLRMNNRNSFQDMVTITFINKSGRRVRLYQSGPYGVEIIYQFTLRPNEPKTINFRPDGSYWIAYDVKTQTVLLINNRKRLETRRVRPSVHFDAKINSDTLPPEPFPVGKVKPLYIQVFVVADYSMVEFYGEAGVKKFTNTLMNIAARAYMHHTLSVPVYLMVVGIDYMKKKPNYYEIIPNQPDISVKGGCRYARRYRSYYKYDFAIILTKEDIGPSGFASMYTMCTSRSCGLVTVDSLDSGYVIAHELGHALGLDHDEDDRCSQNLRGGYIMAKKLYATNSNYRWSRCSARMLRQNLKYFKCLRNKPALDQTFKKNMLKLPGQFYNATQQCQVFHGNSSQQCQSRLTAGSCRYLLCHPSHGMLCRPSRWHAPLEGTPCGNSNTSWCVHGVCENMKKMLPVNGNWTEWTKFSPSCAEGNGSMLLIQAQYRNCTNPRPRNGGEKCKGDNVVYRVVIPYSNNVCKPYSLRNLLTRKEHENFHKRVEKFMDMKDKTLPKAKFNFGNSMMFPCTSSKVKGKTWKEYPKYLQKKYFETKNFSCDFEKPGACGWTSSPLGGKHWSLGMSRTPSYNTGPEYDHTYGNKTGKYIFLEASFVENTKPLKEGDRIIFQSPLMLASEACLKFAYHMHGRTMGSLEVVVRNGKFKRKMWEKKGEQGKKWKYAEISLAINIEYNITLEAVRGKSYYSDIGIDDISVEPGLCEQHTSDKDVKNEECTSICVDSEYTSMMRLQLPTGTPCRHSQSKNNVCLKKVCQPVNCNGIIGRTDC